MAITIDELNIIIDAESKQATNAVDTLIGRLENLNRVLGIFSKAGGKIGGTFKKVNNSVNTASNGVNTFTTNTDKGAKSTQKFTDKLAGQISKFHTLYGAFKAVALVMGNWFNESNDYIETLNLFNVTMGEGADAAYNYAENVQKLVGIDIAEWMNYQGTFKQLTSGFGVASDSANIMSQNLTQLSYDLASFFNTDVETAFDKLSSAMSGQVKGLREFGIDTTVASLQEYALSKGIDTSVRSMTQAEKSLLRYNYIMEKSTLIQGDMARTLVTPSNALRILNAQLTQMKRALGNIISVVVVQFIPYVQAMVQVITEAANSIANFFGFELPKIDYSGLGGNMADEFEDAEDSANGVADAAKKIKKQLMGFDELNILSNPDADSGGGASAGASGGVLGGMEPLEYDFLKGLDTGKLDEVKSKLNKIWKILKPIANLIAGIFAVVAVTKWAGAIVGGISAISAAIYASNVGFALLAWVGGAATFAEAIAFVSASMSPFQRVMLGVATAVAEFLVIFFTIKDLTYSISTGTATLGQIISSVTVVVIALTAAFVAFSIAFNSTGIGLIITLLVGAAAALVGLISGFAESGKAAYEASEDYKIMTAVIEAAETRIETCQAAIDRMNEGIKELDQVSNDYATAKALTTEIFELNEKANLSQYELAQIRTKVEVLNGLNIDGLKLSIDETTGRVVQSREEVMKLIDSLEQQARMEAMRDIIVESYKSQYTAQTELTSAANDYTVASESLRQKQEELANTSWWDFSKRAELKAAIEKEQEAMAKAEESYNKANETLKIANTNIVNLSDEYAALAAAEKGIGDGTVEGLKKMTSSLDGAAETMKGKGAEVGAGAAEGIKSTAHLTGEETQKLADQGIEAYCEALGIHSPSTVFRGFGENMVQGLVNGIQNLKAKASSTITSLAGAMNTGFSETVKTSFGSNNTLTNELNKILENAKNTFSKKTWEELVNGISNTINKLSVTNFNNSLESITNKAKSVFNSSTWEGYARNVTNALSRIQMPTFRSIGLSVSFDTWVSADKEKVYKALGLSGWPRMSWYTYATGGFPDMGEMFIAREAGPELVGTIGKKTAVANNDQIISGIEGGVYRAMVAANANSNGGGTQTIRIINEIDGDVVGEKVIKYHNGKVMQTGVSPLLV